MPYRFTKRTYARAIEALSRDLATVARIAVVERRYGRALDARQLDWAARLMRLQKLIVARRRQRWG